MSGVARGIECRYFGSSRLERSAFVSLDELVAGSDTSGQMLIHDRKILIYRGSSKTLGFPLYTQESPGWFVLSTGVDVLGRPEGAGAVARK